MADLIDRQAAIDAVTMEGCGMCAEVLKDIPAAARWIPVSEGLPEEDTAVLICYRYKYGEGDTSSIDIDITSYGQAYFGGRSCSFKEWRAPFEYFHSNYEVVAWMPLPDLWKGDA